MSELDIASPVFLKDFSLARAASHASVSKPTLRVAIDKGELRATQNAQGHYQIKGQDLFQYIANREADKAKVAQPPSPPPSIDPVNTEGRPEREEPMVPLSVHESVVSTLQSVIEDKQRDVEEWRSRVPLQLTHQKRGRGGHWLLIALTAALSLGYLVWYFYLQP